MNYLLFSGSLRTASYNKKLINVAEKLILENPENQTKVADLKALALPVYDADIEAEGFPEGVI